jgi:translation initiation factor eIF-2B subunit gamma
LLANALSLSTTQSADINDLMDDPIHSSFRSPIKTYVHVYRGGFCGRGNTTASYSELNRYVSYLK